MLKETLRGLSLDASRRPRFRFPPNSFVLPKLDPALVFNFASSSGTPPSLGALPLFKAWEILQIARSTASFSASFWDVYEACRPLFLLLSLT